MPTTDPSPLVEPLDSAASRRPGGDPDVTTVGGKAARLAWLRSTRRPSDPTVPDGFVVTTRAFGQTLDANGLRPLVEALGRVVAVPQRGMVAGELRSAIRDARLPAAVVEALEEQTARLAVAHHAGERPSAFTDVGPPRFAVRSSAVGEDTHGISFAGLHDSFLDVAIDDITRRVLECIASLFTDRALGYRSAQQLSLDGAAMAVLVQPMVRADLGGVVFSRDPDSGRDDVVVEWSAGGPVSVVDGSATPRRLVLARPVDGSASTLASVPSLVPPEDPVLHEVARFAVWAEHALGTPVDIEWVRSGESTAVVQVRPLLVRDPGPSPSSEGADDRGAADRPDVLHGAGIGRGRVEGVVWRPSTPDDLDGVGDDSILVVDHTDPSWLPAMQRAAAVITREGGQTSHAAIVSRELELLAVIGCTGAGSLESGARVVVRCEEGRGSVRRLSVVSSAAADEASPTGS